MAIEIAPVRQLLTNIMGRMYFPVPSSQNTSIFLTEGMFYAPNRVILENSTTASWTVTAGGTGDFTTKMNAFAAYVVTRDNTHSVPVYLYIEAADNAAMSENTRRVAFQVLPTEPGPWEMVMFGACRDGGKQFARVVFVVGIGDGITADLILMGFQ